MSDCSEYPELDDWHDDTTDYDGWRCFDNPKTDTQDDLGDIKYQHNPDFTDTWVGEIITFKEFIESKNRAS